MRCLNSNMGINHRCFTASAVIEIMVFHPYPQPQTPQRSGPGAMPPGFEENCLVLSCKQYQKSDQEYARCFEFKSRLILLVTSTDGTPFTRLLDSGYLSDCTVVCRNIKWATHKTILCSRSKWFRAALDGPFLVRLILCTTTARNAH
jgi:hypothetical protein